MTKKCQKCLLSSKENIHIDDKQLCEYCSGWKSEEWEIRFGITEEMKKEKVLEFDSSINSVKGKYQYDCLLALSGGKDSTYLLYQLTKERSLKVLAVHVNTPFENKIAKKNIDALRQKYNFDIKIIDPGGEFYYRFYKKCL